MIEYATVEGEAFAFAADETAVWLVAGAVPAWRTGRLRVGRPLHWAIIETLRDNGADTGELLHHGLDVDAATIDTGDVIMLHSTSVTAPEAVWASWHQESDNYIHTYAAALAVEGFVPDRWPDAVPVTIEGLYDVDRPPTHAATGVPVPRHVDVAAHALRHVKYLIDTNRENAAALGPVWREHLRPLTPALARMYNQRHAPAA